MPVKYQGGTPKKIYYGSDEVEAIFYGAAQLWPTHPNLEAVAASYALSGKAAALNYSGGGYAFNVTAGTDGSNVGYVASDYGSIDAEPVPAHALETCVYSPLPAVALSFSGDAVSLLAGKHLWVGGVDHGLPQDVGAGADWQYDSDGSLTGAPAVTFGYWLTGYPTFVNGNSYFVEIK